jgi:hypothetical protein
MSTMSPTQHSIRDHSPGVHVVASIALRDDTLAADGGFAGLAVKQQMPGAYSPRDDVNLIAAAEGYFLMDEGECDVELDTAVLGFTPVKGTRLWIDPVTNVVSNAAGSATAAFLVTGTVGANNAIRWTARSTERLPRVQLVDPAAASQALAVDVDGNDIIVSLATSAGSAITSTAAQVIAAVAEHDAASGLVTAGNEGASSGAGVVAAVAITPLAGGAPSTRLKLGIVRYVPPERGLTSSGTKGIYTIGFDARKDM